MQTTSRDPAPHDVGPASMDRALEVDQILELDERMAALEDAADAAMLAPSVHGSQPWTIVLHRDRLELRADRTRQLAGLDPAGRELVQSLGAALMNVRVALAARGWAADVDRLPRPGDPELAALVRPVPGAPEGHLPLLADALRQRRTHRTGFWAEEVPQELLDHLAAAALAEHGDLVAVSSPEDRRLIARLTLEADAVQHADPACADDLRRWQQEPADGRRTVDSRTGEDRTYVLLTSRADGPIDWLRSGEAMERVLLEVTRLGWAASPMTQVLEVPSTRAELRASTTWEAYPQMLLRIGFADARTPSSRRHREDVVVNSTRLEVRSAPADGGRLSRNTVSGSEPAIRRPVSDGRGGTTWI